MPLTPLPFGTFRRLWCNVALMLVLVFLLLLALWLTLPRWLPTLAEWALPDDVHLRLDGRPGWRQGALRLPTSGGCIWATCGSIPPAWRRQRRRHPQVIPLLAPGARLKPESGAIVDIGSPDRWGCLCEYRRGW